MKYSLKLSRKQSLGLALVFILMGLVLAFFDLTVLRAAVQLLGLAMLVYAGYELYQYFIRRSNKAKLLFYGLPGLLIGILMIAMPDVLITSFPIIIGMIMLFSSVSQMQKSFVLKDLQDKSWIFDFFAALLLMLGGLVLIVEPALVVSYILRLSGWFLILEGGFSLFENYQLASSRKRMVETFIQS